MAKRIIGTTPKQDGYRMPAEFEPQQGVWMLWPERNDNWRDGGKPAQKTFADVAKAIARFEKVTVGASVRLEMSRNVQSGNTQNLKSMVIQRSFPKWSVAERRKTAAASNQAAVCACAHSRYFAGGSPSGLRV